MELKPIPGERAAVLGKHLIVSDVHIGFELELWRQGIKIPFQTESLAHKILEIADSRKKQSIILNGDVKHEIAVYKGRQVAELEKFFGILREHKEVIFIKGNHDGGLEGNDHIDVGKNLVFHGHSFPSDEHLGKVWVTGHVHPHISFLDDFGRRSALPVWIAGESGESIEKRYGAREKTRIMVMPALNTMRSGFHINLRERKKGTVSLLDRFSAFLLDGIEVLRVDSVDKPGKGDGIPDMFKFEQGHKKSLDSKAKPAVLDGTILP